MTKFSRITRLFLLLTTIAVTTVSCSRQAELDVQPGVSLDLAVARAAVIAKLNYQLRFDISRDPTEKLRGNINIEFELLAEPTSLQLDFRQPRDNILSLASNGSAIDIVFRNEHLIVPASALRRGRNSLDIEFLTDPSSVNRNPDYLFTLFVPDRARTAFPLFDQPDLKARYQLTLSVPRGWLAMSNANVLATTIKRDRSEYRFAPTDLISSYLFAFVAGEFEAVTRDVGGRSMTMFHRETDAAKLERNLAAIFELHGSSLAWMEDYTGIDYPFQKFDFVLIPDFPYGGMEHVGAILYRADHLLLDEEAPESKVLYRAKLIAHETAHMWFGNLVTMRWFNDVWTKEVFANFIASKIVEPGFPDTNHELNFLFYHYPLAYAVDRSEGANPIRQQLDNLNEAGQMYGSIIYRKAPIMMRQLELVLGQARFQQGMRTYLEQFSYANATWPELIAILDANTDSDLAAWSEVWVNTPGRPHFVAHTAAAEPAGDNAVLQLQQLDPAGQGRIWPQQFSVSGVSTDQVTSAEVQDTGKAALIPAAVAASPIQLYNANGYGYGLFPFDPDTFDAWEDLDELARGAVLINSFDNVLSGTVPDVERYYQQLLTVLQTEQNQLLLDRALSQLSFTYLSLLNNQQRELRAQALEEVLWELVISQPDSSRTKLFFTVFMELAAAPAQVEKLYQLWLGAITVDKLILEEADRNRLAEVLAIRLPTRANAIISRQLADTENPDRLRRLQFIAPSLSADPAVRGAFFESLRDPDNRTTENWVIDALRNLHHPSRLEQSQKYLLPGLELLEEIQVTGDIFFPTHWLDASLGNYHSPQAAGIVRKFLQQRPDYNAQLRMKILQAADPLFRAAVIQQHHPADSSR
jgi:aminopeptidase N